MPKKLRRDFIKEVFLGGVAGYVIQHNPFFSPAFAQDLTQANENLWDRVKNSYELPSGFIDLESGYFSRTNQHVLHMNVELLKKHNAQGAYYMRKTRDAEHRQTKEVLANFSGVSADEIVITRNTTEALNTIIRGIELNPDDEVLMGYEEYGSMLEAWMMRRERYGTKLNIMNNTNFWSKNKTDEDIVQMYADAITPNTKLIMVSHMIFTSGQVMPIRAICDMAHERNVEVMVDGAHAFSHMKEKISDLNCDYYGASLHKWLGAPVGTGIMYIKKEHIPKVWPLFGDVGGAWTSPREYPKRARQIEKFEHIGQHPEYNKISIQKAIEMHQFIGSERKENRLRYLKNYWVNQVKDLPRVTILCPLDGRRSCAIANITIKGIDPMDLAERLMRDYKVFTVGIYSMGVRVAPNLWNDEKDLDRLVFAIKDILSQ